MIRKPDAHEFRESGTVSAIRDASTIAVEGAKVVRDGTAQFVSRALFGLMAFGFLASLAVHIGPVLLVVGLAGGAAWFAKRRRRREADVHARWGPVPSAPVTVGTVVAPERYELAVGAVARRTATIAVPAILFFPTMALGYMLPFALAGITYLALAFLLIVRLFGDRTVLRFDAQALTVVGLLGEATILWADVGDVVVRKTSVFNLKVLFTSGARRNLHVLGRINRLGGPDTLYIPIDLLGLDKAQLHALVTRLLVCRAGAGDVISPAPVAHPVVQALAGSRPDLMAEQALAATSTTRPAVALPVTPAAAAADVSFDPDAIIARYMAEREQLRAEQRPDLTAPRRASFGRKVA